MTLSLRQIEAVYWVAKLRSFSTATKQLNISQPAVSHRIREVENFLGTTLFDRSRGMTLTPAGRDFVLLAERYLALNEELMSRVAQKEGYPGIIRIGAADTIALTWLAPLISKLSVRNPRLSVEITVDLSFSLMAKLISGDLDICFLVGNSPGPNFPAVALGQVRNAWMGSSSLVGSERPLTPRQLANYSIITHSRGSHLHTALTNWFAGHGVTRPHLHSCNSLAGMIELTASGMGVATLPAGIRSQPLHRERLRVMNVTEPLPPTRFSCIHGDSHSTGLYRTIVQLAIDEVSAHPWFEPAILDETPIG